MPTMRGGVGPTGLRARPVHRAVCTARHQGILAAGESRFPAPGEDGQGGRGNTQVTFSWRLRLIEEIAAAAWAFSCAKERRSINRIVRREGD